VKAPTGTYTPHSQGERSGATPATRPVSTWWTRRQPVQRDTQLGLAAGGAFIAGDTGVPLSNG